MLGQSPLPAAGIQRVLAAIVEASMTGALVVTCAPERKALYWLDGGLIGAASTDPADGLGRRLELIGLITAEQAEAVTAASRAGQGVVDYLFEHEILTQDQLVAAVRLQVLEIAWSLFLLTAGSYEFRRGELPDVAAAVELDLAQVIAEGERRRQTAQHQLARLPHPGSSLQATAAAFEADRLRGCWPQVVAHLCAPTTVTTFVRSAQITTFEGLSVVGELLDRGLLSVLPAVAASDEARATRPEAGSDARRALTHVAEADAAAALVAAARASFERGEHGQAVSLFRDASIQIPGNPWLNCLVASAEQVMEDIVRRRFGVHLGQRPVLRPASGTPSALGARLLPWIDGRSTVSELCQRASLAKEDGLLGLAELYRDGFVSLEQAAQPAAVGR